MANTTGKKFGGRTAGTPNRTPEEIRKAVQAFIDRNFESLQSEYDNLDSDKKLTFIEKLLRHVLPRPLSDLERLSDEQLDEIIEKLKKNRNE